MIVSINQPAYLPWLGYYNRIAISDLHVVLDHVQFEKNSFTNRNKIKSVNGVQWLTVPLKTSGKFGDLSINKIEIANQTKWSGKHIRSIQQNYGKAAHFKDYFKSVTGILHRDWKTLNDLLKIQNEFFLNEMEIYTPILFSTDLNLSKGKSDLILEICKKVSATTYLSGTLGRDYLELEIFEANNIEVIFHDYKHPTYAQLHNDFLPNMSVIDLLFNTGKHSIKIISAKNTIH